METPLIMNNQAMNQNPETTNHLKDVFEQSLAMLEVRHAGATAESAATRGSAVPLHIDPAFLQKRALDDAAKALASLWRVPSSTRAKFNNRPIPSNRKVA
jgi:hypothetical protein